MKVNFLRLYFKTGTEETIIWKARRGCECSICLRFRDSWKRNFFQGQGRSATSGGRRATLTGEFDFQHVVFLLVFYSNNIPKRGAVFDLGTWDRQTDGRVAPSLNASTTMAGA